MKTPFATTVLSSALLVGIALVSPVRAQLNGNTEVPRGALAPEDVNFLQAADAANMDQLMLGKRAASRTKDPSVHSFADSMVHSYKKADTELRLLAGAKHVDLQHAPTRKGQDEADELLSNHDVSLERAYIEDVDHNTADLMGMYENARSNSADPDIRAFADEMLVALQGHQRQTSDLISRKTGG